MVFITSSIFFLLFLSLASRKFGQQYSDTLYHDTCSLDLFRFMTNYGGHSLSHLMFLNDKFGYWAARRSVYFSFQKKGKRMIVLGDPIGDEQLFQDAMRELQEDCEKNKIKSPVFYQISAKYMHLYDQYAYRTIKIGEEAKVSLKDFSLTGKQGAKLRSSRNKFQREGFIFKVVYPPYSQVQLEEIKEVSDQWIGKRAEKGFSVSFFHEDYVSKFPIALMYNSDHNLIAFATLPSHQADQEKTIHIDLMRYIPNSPNGTMDVLFTSIFFWAKELNYDYCSLGMAPLSNVGNCEDSNSFYEKLGQVIFNHGEVFYKFKGLKKYKAKFATHWEPRYIAYKNISIIGVLFRLVLLVHKTTLITKHWPIIMKRAS
ncbi:phosphatidylglycerol lysyltransferase domain-containing protein [Bacillus salitolerans]|uniref:Phosphatidylglycerol lysyltransferase domain-containing protein n=1 Tax=Bacillus salitolerans TaxID=1437434 RepID=A0ABW4LTQ9_9BACI